MITSLPTMSSAQVWTLLIWPLALATVWVLFVIGLRIWVLTRKAKQRAQVDDLAARGLFASNDAMDFVQEGRGQSDDEGQAASETRATARSVGGWSQHRAGKSGAGWDGLS